MQLTSNFFKRKASILARDLLGKIIRHKYQGHWLAARIIETESYYLHEKGSHASLGYTEKRKAMFMPAGTIYMYYARGSDSLNISAQGKGNAVLIKSAYYYHDQLCNTDALAIMQSLNPLPSGKMRSPKKLCAGQTLLCRSLNLKVTDWDQQQFDRDIFFIDDINYRTHRIIQTTRLGITKGRDEHLQNRFIDYDFAKYCSSNPLTKRDWIEGSNYSIINTHMNFKESESMPVS